MLNNSEYDLLINAESQMLHLLYHKLLYKQCVLSMSLIISYRQTWHFITRNDLCSISGKVPVGIVRDSRNFHGTHIWGASRGHLCDSSAFLFLFSCCIYCRVQMQIINVSLKAYENEIPWQTAKFPDNTVKRAFRDIPWFSRKWEPCTIMLPDNSQL